MLEYQPRERQRVEPVNDDGPRSYYGTRRGNLANSTESSPSSKLSSKVYPPYKSLMLGTDREHKGRQSTTLAWGYLQRRDAFWHGGICSDLTYFSMEVFAAT